MADRTDAAIFHCLIEGSFYSHSGIVAYNVYVMYGCVVPERNKHVQ